MVEDSEQEPGGFRMSGKTIRFSGTVSLGNLLIILAMLAGGGSTIFVVGTSVQSVQDAVLNETRIRSQSVHELSSKIDTLSAQESRDVADIKLTMSGAISDIRADIRSLVTIAPPSPGPRR